MDMEGIKLLFQGLQFLLTGGIGIYVYLVNKNKVTNERITKLQDGVDFRLDNHTERLARLERDIVHAPTHNDLKHIHARTDEVMGSIKRLDGEFAGANHTLHLIHQYLLNERGHKS